MIIGDSNKISTVLNLKERLNFLFEETIWDGSALCSAFLTEEGAKILIESLSKLINLNDIDLTIIVGIKNYFTSPKAIRLILDFIDNMPKCDFQLLMPTDPEFHIKCYLFWNDCETKFIVGSANLTATGLNSIGEMSIEITDPLESDDIFKYINAYAEESHHWADVIDDYEKTHAQYKPAIRNSQKDPLFQIKTTIDLGKRIKEIAPTMGVLSAIDKAEQDRINEAYLLAKDIFPGINKSNPIIYFDVTDEEIEEIQEEYPIDAWFDRPRDNDKDWGIGQQRMLCRVGGYYITEYKELIMFMKKGNIHYKVNEAILEEAIELGMHQENFLPDEKIFTRYKKFVVNNRN